MTTSNRLERAARALKEQLSRSGVTVSDDDVFDAALMTLMAGDLAIDAELASSPTFRLLNGLRISEPNVVAPVEDEG